MFKYTKRFLVCLLAMQLSGCMFMMLPGMMKGSHQEESTHDLLIIEPVQDRKAYHSFKFHSSTSGIGAEISPNQLKIINENVAEKLKEKGFSKSDEKTMLITGNLIHMDT